MSGARYRYIGAVTVNGCNNATFGFIGAISTRIARGQEPGGATGTHLGRGSSARFNFTRYQNLQYAR
jgi:hypothetical protein